MNIKILGMGCSNCQRLEQNAKQALEELKMEAVIEKVTEIQDIMSYEVMSTPALVIDEKVISAGIILSAGEIEEKIKLEIK